MNNCPVCGENSVTEDTENGRTVRVCTECGAMDNDMHELTSDDRFEVNNNDFFLSPVDQFLFISVHKFTDMTVGYDSLLNIIFREIE
jgi:hypothetical protein